ncbi:glycosyltransferase [Archangium sp.]|uniref:rhamnosyltransferase WsaF family glycosyltransferase n=1 Tax=Archangium sp. TaxID=1872627 RepID=UPI002D3AFF57|nr:glycosyltransferase [Archangium sp.]HYO58511.1 glycosyltransferase [Archangium sp.]
MRSVLEELSEGAPSRTELSADAAVLAELVAHQRELVERLRPCAAEHCAELTAHERILELLLTTLHRAAPATAPRGHTPLQSAWRLVEPFPFSVPESHRSRGGRVVTATKRALVEGLEPLHTELLRPQHEFNRRLLGVLEQLSLHRTLGLKAGLGEWISGQLAGVVEPFQWRVQSHRVGAVGAAVTLVKRSYLRMLGPVLRRALEGQWRFNQAMVEALGVLASPEAGATEAERSVAALERLADPVAVEDRPAWMRATVPLWREVLRRQTRFNQEAVLALADILGVRSAPPTPPSLEGYGAWCERHEPAQVEAAARAAAALSVRPRFSLVVPVLDTPGLLLRACVDSVRAQHYPEWELLLVVEDGGVDPVTASLEALARKDARIRVVREAGCRGVIPATHVGLAAARGEFVAFLDPDGELAPHALASVAVRLGQAPGVDLVYSDEDRLDAQGRRHTPFFKPDWSPDLLRSVDYLGRFLVVRHTLLEEVGRPREGFDGAYGHELALRLSERTHRIAHVPQVLYHGRSRPGAGARGGGWTEATEAGVRALQEHLARLGEAATVERSAPDAYRVRYAVKGRPKVSIIVPFKDRPDLLDTLTRSLLEKTRYAHYELLLVSNNSTRPETFALLDRLTDARIVKLRWDHPFNYPAINNWAAKQATGELLLFLNNDMEVVDPDWLEELVSQAQRPEVGAVGARLLFPEGTVQHAGVVVGLTGFAGHPFWRLPDGGWWTPFGHADWTRDYLSVTSACVAMRRVLFEELGGFDERFQVCGSDVEIGLRLNARGLRVVYTPYARLIHHESASRRVDAIPETDYWLSYAAYRPYLRAGDPFYNPNLTLLGTDCSLREDARGGEALAVQTLARDLPGAQEPQATTRARQQRHVAEHLLDALDHTPEQSRASREEEPRRLQALRARGRLERVTWFVPAFGHPFAGIHTIFRFAEVLQRRHGVQSDFVVYDKPEAHPAEFSQRVAHILGRQDAPFRVLKRPEEVAELPPCDLAIATWWTSAYRVLHHPRAAARAYFVQDYEPLFMPAGTLSALAEQTYRLGFHGIFNGPGLRDYVTSRYPMTGCAFEPTVDHSLFHDRRPVRSGPVRVFFYGRPGNDRNAFELGLAALSRLKRELGAAVEIVSAGAVWTPEDYGVRGVIHNLGVLPYEQTAALYRECDVGLCFMLTHHPSYLPLEMMASGVTVVTNDNPSNHWLLDHGRNCLLTEPTVSGVVAALRQAVTEPSLRALLGAQASARIHRTTWEAEVERVMAQLLAPPIPGRVSVG